MLVLAGLATLAAAGAAADVATLEKFWQGVHDSSEQTVVNTDRGIVGWTESLERRVRTVVAPVNLPWLGPHVLYLEEFLQDEPDQVRRQVLLVLERKGPPEAGVRVHLYGFIEPTRWSHLDRRARLAGQLRQDDIGEAKGCELLLRRDGEQFIGGTLGRGCRDPDTQSGRYVDYQLVIGPQIYWYRRRILAKADDEVAQELMGYNWFEPNAQELYACRIDWSATGRAADLKPLRRMELNDQGGHGRFVTPDGRSLELTLHSQDWPFVGERDALILMVHPQGSDAPIGSAWSTLDIQQVTLDIGWLRVQCGALAPDTDELDS
jgi:CpeT/CpcT family protein DUF1001